MQIVKEIPRCKIDATKYRLGKRKGKKVVKSKNTLEVIVEQHAQPPQTIAANNDPMVTASSDTANNGNPNHKMENDGNVSDSSESGTIISTTTEGELDMNCYESILENFQTNWDPMGID